MALPSARNRPVALRPGPCLALCLRRALRIRNYSILSQGAHCTGQPS